MALLKIELFGAPVLREKAQPVEAVTPEILRLLDDMAQTMRHAGGAGLAANQVGVAKRLLVIDLGAHEGKENLVYLINPEYTVQEGEMVQEEGCLSIPQIYERVKRPQYVAVKALDREGKPFELDGEDFLAKALSHEMDHLDGVLFIDRLSPFRRDIVKRKIRKLIKDGEWEDPYPVKE
jgi:peptide deformylase